MRYKDIERTINFAKMITWHPGKKEFVTLLGLVTALLLSVFLIIVAVVFCYINALTLIISCSQGYLQDSLLQTVGILVSIVAICVQAALSKQLINLLSPERLFKNG